MKRIICILLVVMILCSCTPSRAETAPDTQPSAQATMPAEPVFDPNRIISKMSTEQLVGQLFLARCPSDETAVTHLQDYHLGGYILFGRDFENETPTSAEATIQSYILASEIPPLIAVDEEGGSVVRVSSQSAFRSQRFPSLRSLYAEGGMERIQRTETEKCQLLSGLGINVNMAPVCDITTDRYAFMYDRSLGLDPQQTGACIAAIVNTMAQNRIGSVLKHFPGYGNNTDTHTGIAVDERSLEALRQADLVPFQAGIDAGAGAILISHTIVSCLDQTMPASLSSRVIGYLREQMDFNGVAVTDDLVMDAITNQYGTGEAAILAVLAGNDLLCSSEYAEQYQAVLEAVKNGRIPLDRVKEAAFRILQWKYDLGLLQPE